MQKTRRLMDENSVSFQMFLIPLSFVTLGSESQLSVFKQCQSNTQMSVFCFVLFCFVLFCFVLFCFFWGGGGRTCEEAKIWRIFSVKKKIIRLFAQFNFSRLSLAFISKYYLISCGEKIIRLAFKNSVKLGEK